MPLFIVFVYTTFHLLYVKEAQTRIAFDDHTFDLPAAAAQHHTFTKEAQTRIAVEHHTSDDLPATPHHPFTKETKGIISLPLC